MTITFLGTGTSQGVPVVACDCPVCHSADQRDRRLRSSVLISSGGINFLIDAGPDFRQQMLTHQVHSLRAILLTHEHVDHVFGLDDIRAFNWVQQQPMEIYAEERVEVAIKRIFSYVFAWYKYPGIPQMSMIKIDNNPFRIEHLEFIPVRAYHHKLPVYGFRMGGFAYMTDINSIETKEKRKLEGLDVLVVNALRKEEHISHYNLEGALGLIGELKPQRAYLTHISHQMGFYRDVSAELPPNVFLAYDGLTLSV